MEGLNHALESTFDNSEVATSAPVKRKVGKGKATLPPAGVLRYAAGKGSSVRIDTNNGNTLSFFAGDCDVAIKVYAVVDNDTTLGQRMAERTAPDGFRHEDEFTKDVSWKHVPTSNLKDLPWLFQAVSTDVTRYNLAAVFFEGANSYRPGTAVATDGYRLHMVTGLPVLFEKNTLVHSGMISTLLAALKWLKPESIEVAETANFTHWRMRSTHASFYAVARKVDGKFPDYTQVIPTDPDHVWQGHGPSIARLLETAPKNGTDKGATFAVHFGDVLTIRAPTQLKAAPVALPVESSNPLSVREVYQARYVQDAFDCVVGSVSIGLAEAMSPLTIRSGERLALIMPMRQ